MDSATRMAYRLWWQPDATGGYYGFRCAMSAA